MKRMMMGVAAAALALAACGSSGDDAGSDTAATTAAATATTAAAAGTTAAAAGTTAAAAADTTAAAAAGTTAAAGSATTGAAAAAGTVAVTLDEFTVVTGAVKAGSVSFDVKNDGEFPHELIIIKADSFDSLPKDSSGGVDEAALAAGALVAQTDRIQGGASAPLTATLAAGKYVFVCNLGQGANNHAAKGQHLDVTVG